MKRLIVIQIIINIIFLIIFILVILGKMVDVKYNYDDPLTNSSSVSQDFYSLIQEFGITTAVFLTANIVCSFVLLRKFRVTT